MTEIVITKSGLMIKDATILFKDFEGTYHPKFNPNKYGEISVFIPADAADELAARGYNIRYKGPNESSNYEEEVYDDNPMGIIRKTRHDIFANGYHYLKVAIRFDKVPPIVRAMVDDTNYIVYDKLTIHKLDDTYLGNTQISINASEYEPGKKKAYLANLLTTIVGYRTVDDFSEMVAGMNPIYANEE